MWPCARRLQMTPNDQNKLDVKVGVSPVRGLNCSWLAQDCRGVLIKFEKSLKNVRNAKNDTNHKNVNSAM